MRLVVRWFLWTQHKKQPDKHCPAEAIWHQLLPVQAQDPKNRFLNKTMTKCWCSVSNYVFGYLGGLTSQVKEFYKAASHLLMCKEKHLSFFGRIILYHQSTQIFLLCVIFSLPVWKSFIKLNICAQYKSLLKQITSWFIRTPIFVNI